MSIEGANDPTEARQLAYTGDESDHPISTLQGDTNILRELSWARDEVQDGIVDSVGHSGGGGNGSNNGNGRSTEEGKGERGLEERDALRPTRDAVSRRGTADQRAPPGLDNLDVLREYLTDPGTSFERHLNESTKTNSAHGGGSAGRAFAPGAGLILSPSSQIRKSGFSSIVHAHDRYNHDMHQQQLHQALDDSKYSRPAFAVICDVVDVNGGSADGACASRVFVGNSNGNGMCDGAPAGAMEVPTTTAATPTSRTCSSAAQEGCKICYSGYVSSGI